ncbi:efflux RND transporter periplasmic adaptor subunit [Pseudalkalibacillus sp. Hm43]|uniref:efflux RND transporter periplasmic adaptor subunit n=1 Tax=Pseudalkalibacillus sp. Hm43 TaxID=3450742 RepID=UPI003F43C591
MNGYIKKALIALPIILFVIINTYLFILNESIFASEKPYEVTRIEQRDLKETIQATGVVVPKEKEEFYFDESRGTLEEILVQEGDDISSGTDILQYSASNYDQQVVALENEIDVLETEKDYHEDRERLIGNQILRESAKDEEERDDSALLLLEQEEADAEYQADRIDSMISNKEDEIKQLESRSGEMTVKSSISGTVQKVSYERGSAKEPLVVLANEDNVMVRTFLSEKEVLLLQEGDDVQLKSAKDKEWKGIIASIQPAEEKQEGSEFQVDVEVEQEGESTLQVGSTVEMTVRPIAVKDAVAVRHESILQEDGKQYVLVVKNGYIDKRQVSFGFENKTYLEVTKGLKAEEVIVKVPNRLLVDDMEIEVVDIEKEKKAKEEQDQTEEEQDPATDEDSENNG